MSELVKILIPELQQEVFNHYDEKHLLCKKYYDAYRIIMNIYNNTIHFEMPLPVVRASSCPESYKLSCNDYKSVYRIICNKIIRKNGKHIKGYKIVWDNELYHITNEIIYTIVHSIKLIIFNLKKCEHKIWYPNYTVYLDINRALL